MADPETPSLDHCVDEIEEAYEFMLAYAAQGRDADDPSDDAADVRKYLTRAGAAMRGLAGAVTAAGGDSGGDDSMARFVALLDDDIRRAGAAIDLVLAQPVISSEIVDNLNASIHLRALLTNMFLIDSVLKARA